MKKLLVGGVLLCLCGAAFAANTAYHWRNVGTDYSGEFTDLRHWGVGSAGGESPESLATDLVNFNFAQKIDYSVTMPPNGYMTGGNIYILNYDNHTNVFDYSGTYVLQGPSAGGYGSFPINICVGTQSYHYIFDIYNGGDTSTSVSLISNLVLTVRNGKVDGVGRREVLFEGAEGGGLVDFFKPDPEADVRRSSLRSFFASAYSGVYRVTFRDVDTRWTSILYESGGTVNELVFDGGLHEFHQGESFGFHFKKGTDANPQTNVVRATGGALVDFSDVTVDFDTALNDDLKVVFSAEGGATIRRPLPSSRTKKVAVLLSASTGGTLELTNSIDVSQIDVGLSAGGVLSAPGNLQLFAADGQWPKLRVTDGSTVSGTNLSLGRFSNNNGIDALFADSTVAVGGELYLSGCEAVFSNCTVTAKKFGLNARTGKTAHTTFSGGTFAVSDCCRFGSYYYDWTGAAYASAFGTNEVLFTDGAQATIAGNSLTLNDAEIGYNVPTVFTVDGEGSLVHFKNSMGMAWGGDSKFVRTCVKGGELRVTGNAYLARNALGRLEVEGGLCSISGSVNAGNGGSISVSGGELRMASYSGHGSLFTSADRTFEVTGGRVTCPNISIAGVNAASCGRMALDGGELVGGGIYPGPGAKTRGGTGGAVFEADGGTWTVPTGCKDWDLLSTSKKSFDEALLGEKGLNFRSESTPVYLYGDFSTKPGASSSRLTISSVGEVVLTGANAQETYLDVAGGTVTVADGASHHSHVTVTNGATFAFAGAPTPLRGLTLGTDEIGGTLVLDVTKPLTVEGDVVIGVALLQLRNAAANQTYDVISVGGEVSAESLAAWSRAQTVSGVPAGFVCEPTWTTDPDTDKITLQLKIRESQTVTLSYGAGDSSLSTNVTVSAVDALDLNVAADGVLTASGALGMGELVKSGAGAMRMTNAENEFLGGVTLAGGRLIVDDFSVLGATTLSHGDIFRHAGGVFAYEGTADAAFPLESYVPSADEATAPLVIEAHSDFTIPVWNCVRGCLIKRGAGRLTIESKGTTVLSTSRGLGANSAAPGPQAPAKEAVVKFADDGSAPTNGYGSVSVAEGELYLKGTGENNLFRMDTSAMPIIGMPLEAAPAAPVRLTIDGATLDATADSSAGANVNVGPNCNSTVGKFGDATLALTNGAVLKASLIAFGRSANNAFTGRTECVNSRLDLSYQFWTAQRQCSGIHRFDGSELLCGSGMVLYSARDRVTFDNGSVFAKNAAHDPATLVFSLAFDTVGQVEVRVTGGSKLCLNKFSVDLNNSAFSTGVKFVFDGGEWIPGTGDFAFLFPQLVYGISIETLGEGLVLAPPEGKTWRMETAVTGAGGVRMSGAGTLVFGPARAIDLKTNETNDLETATAAFDGELDVAAGTVRFEAGSVRDGLRIRADAAGTIAGSALVSPVFVRGDTESETLTLDGCVLSGRVKVDFGRTSENPVTEDCTVLRYVGADPDVSRWRAVNLGDTEHRGVFTAADGVITMALGPKPGALILVR